MIIEGKAHAVFTKLYHLGRIISQGIKSPPPKTGDSCSNVNSEWRRHFLLSFLIFFYPLWDENLEGPSQWKPKNTVKGTNSSAFTISATIIFLGMNELVPILGYL